VAIVAQKSDAVQEYLKKNALPFLVLVDSSRDVLKAYGVWHRVGLDAWNIARPALFLIARDGTIARRFVARRQDQFPSHEEILEWLDRFSSPRTHQSI
jgi:peroxiredoxin Q/BCP